MNRRLLVVAGACLSVATAGSARAQAPAQGNKAEVLSDQEKVSRANEYLKEMRQALKNVLAKLEEARSTKDVVKLNCVNEKLTNIKGLMRISEQSDITLQEAIGKREDAGAEHEFSKLTIARQKVQVLRTEAEQCVGLLAFETGPTEVVVEEPRDLPQLDPTQTPAPAPVVSRAPSASPTN